MDKQRHYKLWMMLPGLHTLLLEITDQHFTQSYLSNIHWSISNYLTIPWKQQIN